MRKRTPEPRLGEHQGRLNHEKPPETTGALTLAASHTVIFAITPWKYKRESLCDGPPTGLNHQIPQETKPRAVGPGPQTDGTRTHGISHRPKGNPEPRSHETAHRQDHEEPQETTDRPKCPPPASPPAFAKNGFLWFSVVLPVGRFMVAWFRIAFWPV